MDETKNLIKEKIENLKYFYRHGYMLESKELQCKKLALDEKREQIGEQMYFLETLLEQLNSETKPNTK